MDPASSNETSGFAATEPAQKNRRSGWYPWAMEIKCFSRV